MKLRALIIEDCDTMRNLLMQMLPLTGLAEFKFTEAKDGLDALDRFDAGKTDIMFVDWKMPKLTGIDFVRKIRASGKANHIPIVMVTGIGTMGNIQEALDEAGADIYITKPYTINELRQKLSRVIQKMEHAPEGQPESKPAGLLGKLLRGHP